MFRSWLLIKCFLVYSRLSSANLGKTLLAKCDANFRETVGRRLCVSEPALWGVCTCGSCYSFAKLAISLKCLAMCMMYVEDWWRVWGKEQEKTENTWKMGSKVCVHVHVCVFWHVWGGVWASRGKAHKTHDHTDEVTGSETGESLSFPVWFHPSPSYPHLSIFPLFCFFLFLTAPLKAYNFFTCYQNVVLKKVPILPEVLNSYEGRGVQHVQVQTGNTVSLTTVPELCGSPFFTLPEITLCLRLQMSVVTPLTGSNVLLELETLTIEITEWQSSSLRGAKQWKQEPKVLLW